MPASQPEISAVLVGVHPTATDPAAGSALLSLQSYLLQYYKCSSTHRRHEERRLVSKSRLSRSGRPLATTIERAHVARHTSGYCYYRTQLAVPRPAVPAKIC